MRERTYWIDHVLSPTRQFTVVATDTDSVYTITPYGTVMQQGTAQSADNFNSVEEGLVANEIATDILLIHARQQEWELDELTDDLSDYKEEVSGEFTDVYQKISDEVSTLNTTISDEVADLEELIDSHELTHEVGTVTLTNSLTFPFNDSQVTVALTTAQPNIYYWVYTEVTAFEGNVGEIEITGKQTNGFKIAYTGSASSVTIQYTIVGGYIK